MGSGDPRLFPFGDDVNDRSTDLSFTECRTHIRSASMNEGCRWNAQHRLEHSRESNRPVPGQIGSASKNEDCRSNAQYTFSFPFDIIVNLSHHILDKFSRHCRAGNLCKPRADSALREYSIIVSEHNCVGSLNIMPFNLINNDNHTEKSSHDFLIIPILIVHNAIRTS